MNIRDLINAHLSELGADGLCNPGEECGCGIRDLCACDCHPLDCVPAKRVLATEVGDCLEVGDPVFVPVGRAHLYVAAPEKIEVRG